MLHRHSIQLRTAEPPLLLLLPVLISSSSRAGERWKNGSYVFHGFHSPGFLLTRSFVNRLGLANLQPVFVDDGEAVKRVLPSVDRHGPRCSSAPLPLSPSAPQLLRTSASYSVRYS